MPRVRADAAAAPCLRPRGLLHNDAEPVVLTELLGFFGSPRNSASVGFFVFASISFHPGITVHRQSRNAPTSLFLLYVSRLFVVR